MTTFKIDTKNKVDIDKKPRVYFTCHPDDFEKYFQMVCNDIFKTHDCAIYYTEDMNETIAEENKEIDLGRNNLFVIPITFKLLTTPNRAMDIDFPYAVKEHIPVLPIMMEGDIDAFYAKPDKFGERQYLNRYAIDSTEISYEEKLKKFLESVLISDQMAKRIRAIFDAYIFLSYRKKDRRYANELIRLIHSIPECRDIAIWYDEFLTPGESFKKNIDQILHDSKLFTLLVTPSLLEESGGKPNFVMGEEYPAARKSGITILPAEMVDTDKETLRKKFEGIPDCVNPYDSEFSAHLLKIVTDLAIESNNTPEHDFLLGLAYLDGIDVEVDRTRAVELITSAANTGLPEAMTKLYDMYNEGIGVALDYKKAAIWAKIYADYMILKYGEEHPATLTSLNNLALTYHASGEYKKAAELTERIYILYKRVLGEEHPDTLTVLGNLAAFCKDLGNPKKALELQENVYNHKKKVRGEEHPETLLSLGILALTYGDLGENEKAANLLEKVYICRKNILGEEHPDTLTSLNNLAFTYGRLGEYKKVLELQENVYALRKKVLGEEHPRTLATLNNLAGTHRDMGEYEKATKLLEKINAIQEKLLGEEHPDTLTSLHNLALNYIHLGKYKEATELSERVYILSTKVLGEEHSRTLITLGNLAVCYRFLEDFITSLSLWEKLYPQTVKLFGETHYLSREAAKHIEELKQMLNK